jgi:hypothetical protein
MNTTQTAGQALTAELRRYFHIGPRTRAYRNGLDVKAQMLEAITNALYYPGYYGERTQEILRTARDFVTASSHVITNSARA